MVKNLSILKYCLLVYCLKVLKIRDLLSSILYEKIMVSNEHALYTV